MHTAIGPLNGEDGLFELPLRVLIADSEHGIDDEIRARLERDERFAVCAQVSEASGAVEAALATRPHVALIGVDLPGGGVAAARETLARLPQLMVVMLAADKDDLFPALRAGAEGYLVREMNLDRLPQTLWDAATGTSVAMPRVLMREILARFRDQSALRRSVVTADAGPLTSREWQVLSQLRAGKSSALIARRLSISVATVRSHRRRIRQKLGPGSIKVTS